MTPIFTDLRPFRVRHLCISGFLTDRGDLSGLEMLWRKLWNEYQCYDDVLVEYLPWSTCWECVAEQIFKFRPADSDKLEVYVYCHSYGGGWGFRQLAKYLAVRGIKIRCAVLCDAVYRGFLLGKAFSLTASLLPWPKIKVGPNVDEVYWFYQRASWLCGHEVYCPTNPEVVHPGIKLWEDHYHIDENQQFQNRVMEVAARCIK